MKAVCSPKQQTIKTVIHKAAARASAVYTMTGWCIHEGAGQTHSRCEQPLFISLQYTAAEQLRKEVHPAIVMVHKAQTWQ
jgi:hypothetical protein